jgi:hypothetical protein
MNNDITFFDAYCAECHLPESKHTPEIMGENPQVRLVCPAGATQHLKEAIASTRSSLEAGAKL